MKRTPVERRARPKTHKAEVAAKLAKAIELRLAIRFGISVNTSNQIGASMMGMRGPSCAIKVLER